MSESTPSGKDQPSQPDIARGTPPARTPETLPETDLEPDQAPVRDTPDVRSSGTPPVR
ncbi:hypothetical protein [Trinickia diaoshuihuensis]|uniref:hypothetical protein n=1 Tax=Trinickia diaoshuihuensis TaxID=2292265 RepID=UPI0013C31B94|nr:hypothetical protein [Trinickia diaoshuihuensis]